MSYGSKAVRILVPGPLHQEALDRIGREFTMVRAEAWSGGELPSEVARGVAGLCAIIPISSAMIDLLPDLEIIAHFGVGYDSVDVRHAAFRGIVVTNTPAVLNEDVADVAFGLLVNTVRELPRAERWLRDGKWASAGAYPITRHTLRDRRAGIFGLGRVGMAIARRLAACGLEIAYHNRNIVTGIPYPYYPSLLALAEAVDTLICVVPSTTATERIVDSRVFEALGANGVFINIGRGKTVDQEALIAALRDGTIAAAGLDVYSDEPNVPKALLDLPNAVLLPHVGSATEWTREAMANLCVDNLAAWFSEGRALTPVSETAHIRSRGFRAS